MTKKILKREKFSFIISSVLFFHMTQANADWTDALCDIYPKGSDSPEKIIPCIFSQRQGYITITRNDGVTHDLSPTDKADLYTDDKNREIVREYIPGDGGFIFRLSNESVYVYWNTSALHPDTTDANNWTAPYTTEKHDATTRLKCGKLNDNQQSCPAGILRMEDKQASIVITSPSGQEFTINFMTDYINATGREVQSRLNGDTWIIDIDNAETYEIPLAAIEGG